MADFMTPGSSYVPAVVEKQREVEEYYDKLEYLKSRRLQQVADSQGNSEMSSAYARQANQTVVGIPYSPKGINSNIFQAVPQNMRPFVSSFAQATGSEQEKIRQVLPKYQQSMFEQIWAGNSGSPIGDGDGRGRADEEVARYFSQRELPDSDSALWHPDVDLDEYKMKTFENEGINYFTQGIPEAKAREFRELGRADLVLDSTPFNEDVGIRNSLLSELRANHSVSGSSIRMSSISGNNNVHYDNPRRRHIYDRVENSRF
jgi:hypothetical protein